MKNVLFILAIVSVLFFVFIPSVLACSTGMTEIKGGTFTIGANNEFPEEKPAQSVTVKDFCIDTHEVTNQQFAEFVEDTGYITIAERPLSVAQFPELTEEDRSPGSVVFQPIPEGQPVT